MTSTIALISTGGTIEKTYDDPSGVLANKISVLDVMLASLELRGVDIRRVALMNKDSLEMTSGDHTLIAETAVELSRETAGVVIVHGTDRLAVSGERVVELVGTPPSPIVFTGAMRPYELRSTDAVQNLVEALIAVQLVPPGVYVAMHNQVLRFPGVVKDRTAGTFVSRPRHDAAIAGDVGPVAAALLDAMTNANIGYAILVHRDGRFEKWLANESAIRNFGYSVEEWLTKPMFEVVSPDQRQQVAQLYERLLGEVPLPPAIEITFVHREGHTVRAELAVARVDLPEGRALVTIMPDLGVQMQLLEADRIALVGALAAGFAHETNNPLTSVLLNLRSLRKQLLQHLSDGAQSAALRCLDDITTGAERIASNVRAFQTLASRSATQPIDLAVMVSAVLRLALPTLEPRAHVIRQIFPVRPVAGEESRIGQAVLAMLLFASSGFDQVASAGNRIVVAVEERDGAVIVEVSDNGRELAADEARRAFDPFFRSPTRGAGVGVGLGVARSVATTLGGTVNLAPRPGGGAVITMKLPPTPA